MKRLLVAAIVVLIIAVAVGYMVVQRNDAGSAVTVADDLEPRPEAPAEAPNVVLVVGCTVRADQLTFHNHHVATTPFLARMADEGVMVHRAIAQAPWTKAAATALVTGQHPMTVGIVEPGPDMNSKVLPDDATTLAERFRSGGYTTVGLTANPNLNETFGFHQGFDVYVGTPGLWRDETVDKLDGNEVVDNAFAAIDRLSAAAQLDRLFLQLVLVDAHFPAEGLTEEEVAAFADEAPSNRVARYRAMLRRLDARIERLYGGLVERGFNRDNTVFVFIADHGEGLHMPAHHGVGHGNYLFPSTVRVPWLLWGQQVTRGSRITGLAAQVDLAPTLLSLAGIDGYEGPGIDLSSLVTDDDPRGKRSPREEAFTDTWFQKSNRAARYTRDGMCQKNFGEPDSAFSDGCFERVKDPYFEHPQQDEDGIAEVVAWRQARQAELDGAAPAANAEVDAGVVDQLRALGYVE